MTRILVVDDHPMVRSGLRTMLASVAGLQVVAEAEDGLHAISQVRKGGIDLVLMDLQLPRMGGIEATRAIREEFPEVRVLVLTSQVSGSLVKEAVKAGAQGYALKDATLDELSVAIRAVAAGASWLSPDAYDALMRGAAEQREPAWLDALTPRERSVLEQIVRGRSNKEAARALGLTEGTVKGYVTSLLRKMGVEDRTQAALAASRTGMS